MRLPILFLLLASPFLRAEEKPAHVELTEAAQAFLATLDEAKHEQASFPFETDERENWHYTPVARKGLPLKAMNDAQKNAAVALAAAILSEKGEMKAAQIISLEAVLASLENRPDFRDPEKYYISLFGKPGDPDGWAFRIEGHHLSINITVVGEEVAVTPSFMGANPAQVREGEKKGLRPLAAEEDLARALAAALIDTGKKDTLFSEEPPEEILTGENREAQQLDPVGLAASDMSDAQRDALIELISEYTGRHREDVAEKDLAAIRAAGIDKIRFGWAGSLERGKAFYYRVQGPTFLLECANTQNDANHIHTVWRDFADDFGRDLLRHHLEHDH